MDIPAKKGLRPSAVTDRVFVTFHVCTAPAGPLSRVLGTLTVEAVNDPMIDHPAAVGLVVYDNDKQPLVAIMPGNIPLAAAIIAQLLDNYGVAFAEVIQEAQEQYEVI
jgi:hypothetical protein